MDNAVKLAYEKDFQWKTDGNPAAVWFLFFFVNGNREGKKKRGKEKLHSLKGDKNTYMATELPKKTPRKQAWKHCLRRRCIQQRRMGRLEVGFFLKAPRRGVISRNCCYLYIHSHLFQSMVNRRKSLVKGSVDLVLLSLSTSPHPHLPSALFPLTTWLKSAPNPSLHWTEPHSSHVGRVQTCL